MARRPRPLRPLPPKKPRRPQSLRLLPRKRLPAPQTHTSISRQKPVTQTVPPAAPQTLPQTPRRALFPKIAPYFQEKPQQNVTLPILSRQVASISCHGAENSSQISTPFDLLCAHPIPFRYPSCLPTAACDGGGRKPSGPLVGQTGPALDPRRRRGARLHHQQPYAALICSTVPPGRRSDFRRRARSTRPRLLGPVES